MICNVWTMDDLYNAFRDWSTDGRLLSVVDTETSASSRLKPNLSPLHTACKSGWLESVQELVKRGERVNAGREEGEVTPLHVACGVNVYTQSGVQSPGLCPHTEQCMLKIIQTLVNAGADVHAKDKGNFTPLHQACISSSPRIIKFLIHKGACVNALDYFECTPLHVVVMARSCNEGEVATNTTEIIGILLDAGSAIEGRQHEGKTPLFLAFQRNFIDIVEYLVRRGADIHTDDNEGQTMIRWAVNRLGSLSQHKERRMIQLIIHTFKRLGGDLWHKSFIPRRLGVIVCLPLDIRTRNTLPNSYMDLVFALLRENHPIPVLKQSGWDGYGGSRPITWPIWCRYTLWAGDVDNRSDASHGAGSDDLCHSIHSETHPYFLLQYHQSRWGRTEVSSALKGSEHVGLELQRFCVATIRQCLFTACYNTPMDRQGSILCHVPMMLSNRSIPTSLVKRIFLYDLAMGAFEEYREEIRVLFMASDA